MIIAQILPGLPNFDFTAAVSVTLLGICALHVALLQIIVKVFWEPERLPTIPLVTVPLAMVPLGFLTAFYVVWAEGEKIDPLKTWWIQGEIAVVVMLTAWLGVREIFTFRRPIDAPEPTHDVPAGQPSVPPTTAAPDALNAT